MILNMITTGAMVRIGKTLGNRMVDFRPSNEKLRIRSRRILRELSGLDDATAAGVLARCGGDLKRALVVALAGVEPDEARALLDAHAGQVPRISRVWSMSTKPCLSATVEAHRSTAGPSTSTVAPQCRQTR